MKTNWLWDSKLSKKEARAILKNAKHPKFEMYAAKLLSRVSDPTVVFGYIDEVVFCKSWPGIKKRLARDRWLKNKIVFWQAMHERRLEVLKEKGVAIRQVPQRTKIPPERAALAGQIRDIRIKLGYTQKELAKKLGVIQQYISKIESGRENISIGTLKRIADAFDKKLVVALI